MNENEVNVEVETETEMASNKVISGSHSDKDWNKEMNSSTADNVQHA